MRYVLAAGSSGNESIRRREDGSLVFTDTAINAMFRRNGEFAYIHPCKRNRLRRISSRALQRPPMTDVFRHPALTGVPAKRKRLLQACSRPDPAVKPLLRDASLGTCISRKSIEPIRGHLLFRIGLGESTRFRPLLRAAPK